MNIDPHELLVLNRYSVDSRYPGDWDEFTRAEAEEAFRIARKVRDAARKILCSDQ